MRAFLDRDHSSHWYLVPADKRDAWGEWLDIPEDDERSWDAPEWATPLGGGPQGVTFTDWKFA